MKATENIYVLVTLHGGLIDQVTIHDDRDRALKALERFVTTMNPEDDDAAVFAPEGPVRNAKDILDGEGECDPYGGRNPIYVIGNPEHHLGFMVASPDDPLGFDTAAEALSELGQMRKDAGSHLKLYRVIPVEGPVATRAEVEAYNAECDVEGFDYSLVEEYLG
jgi:hypothetical protein